MSTLRIMQGLPGSGKTTEARQMDAWRVSRDDLRRMLRATWDYNDEEAEQIARDASRAVVGVLLAMGLDVVVDDTNLNRTTVDAWAQMAVDWNADFRIRIMQHVPLETCIARDAQRSESERVGREKITEMWARFVEESNATVVAAEMNPGV